MEIRDLQLLLSLDQHRHFGRAAGAVGLSQPALSKSLQRLEQDLGVKLFDRSRAGVVPTTVGQEVIRQARRLVSHAAEMKRTVDLMRGIEVGSIHVGVGPAMSESFITSAIARIADQHPQVRMTIRVDHWRQLSGWLLTGEVDLFIADIEEASQDPRFECTPLPTETFVWFCRKAHPLAKKKSVSRGDMIRYPLATPKMPAWARRWFAEAKCDVSGEANSDSVATIECENYSMLKRIVLSSNCISAALQSTIESELDANTIAVLRVRAPKMKTTAGVVQLRDRAPSPLAEALTSEVLNRV
jgi:DNA-binding transcriptional LysR family regulator